MNTGPIHILLAEDDEDDCALFADALVELEQPVKLTMVRDGERLMQFLDKNADNLPDVLFLDMNMPRKNGLESLVEIKKNEKLKELPVIILSTSFDAGTLEQLVQHGARHYIRKPNEFSKLKKVIYNALLSIRQAQFLYNSSRSFILLP